MLGKKFRIWWKKPRSHEEYHIDREVSFLELFYDLVYVVLIAQAAHFLGHHISWEGLGQFILLSTFIVWAWMNGMYYHSLHGQNDVSTRVFTFIQMFLVGGMAVFAQEAFGVGAWGFSVMFAAFQIFFAFLWFRSGYHDPDHRPISIPTSILYILFGVVMIISNYFPNQQVGIWLAVIVIHLLIPFLNSLLPHSRKNMQLALKLGSDSVERFGLITIIAIGEVIISAITGVSSSEHQDLRTFLIAGGGMLVAISIWWLYFDYISRQTPKDGSLSQQLFSYLHIPIIVCISGIGGIVREFVVHNHGELADDTRWIFVLLVSILLVSISILVGLVMHNHSALEKQLDKSRSLMYLLAFISIMLGFTSIGFIGLLWSVGGLLLLPIFYGIHAWVTYYVDD